jgi:uncharacterized membrane protein
MAYLIPTNLGGVGIGLRVGFILSLILSSPILTLLNALHLYLTHEEKGLAWASLLVAVVPGIILYITACLQESRF